MQLNYGKDDVLKKYIKSEDPLKLRANNKKILDLPIFETILNETSPNYSDKARIYLYILGKYNIKCSNENCVGSGEVKFDNDKNKFRQYCSISCRNQDLKLRAQASAKWTNKKKEQKNIKTKETCLKKYGVENVMQDKNVQQKTKETCLKKYGVEYTTQSEIMKEKTKKTILERYGIATAEQESTIRQKDVDNKQEIVEYIESLGVKVIRNSLVYISPLELDIVCPEHNVAIEFNSLYTHSYGANNMNNEQSDLSFNKQRHLEKTEACNKSSIQLFHIFENEWSDSRIKDIWKAQISNALKQNKITIGARKCKIKELTTHESNNFLDNNHLQGKCVASVKLGLVYENEIVSVMTFGKSRYDKNIDYELIRFCSKKYVQVPGGASRLLKYFEKEYSPHGLVSYANARWSTGHLYKTIGFQQLGFSQPNYFYFHETLPETLYSRVKFQKHKLYKALTKFNPDLTEMQNTTANGYRAIFDAGNYKFTKTYYNA